jgi:uncharacterized protein (TIGR03083 family)
MKTDYLQLLLDESRDLVSFLETLSADDWDAPSLCRGWRVRDVISHMAVGHTMPVVSFGAAVARNRFQIDRTSYVLATSHANSHTPRQILNLLRKGTLGRPRAAARFVPVHELFTDHLVHHQDVRRALGMPRDVPADRGLAALQTLHQLSSRVGSGQRMSGLRVIATDVDFDFGRSPLELRGTAEALLMVLTGRSEILPEISGSGIPTVNVRLERAVKRRNHTPAVSA